jgi:uncharacterized protein
MIATASVVTSTPDRYLKQLASHLGRKAEVREEMDGTRLVLAGGECLLRTAGESLEMTASAPDAETLERVTDVVGRHLERFGQRNELQVTWTGPTTSE